MKRRHRLLRTAGRIMCVPGLVYAGLLGLLWLRQDGMVFPGARQPNQAVPATMQPPAGAGLLRLTTEGGERIAALFGPALKEGKPHPRASVQPAVLLFYGNGSSLEDAAYTLQEFREQGFNVLVPEYVGYGLSAGRPSEAGCRDTASAAYRHLVRRRDIDPRRIIAAGYSLGGAVAIELASRERVAGVAGFNTFTRMDDVAQRLFPWAPVRPFLRHRFASVERIPEVGCPVFLAHASGDELVPPEMSDLLGAASKAPVTTVRIPEATHNNLFDVGRERVFGPFRYWAGALNPR